MFRRTLSERRLHLTGGAGWLLPPALELSPASPGYPGDDPILDQHGDGVCKETPWGMIEAMRLRLDPWAAEYGTTYRAEEAAAEAVAKVDLSPEMPSADWSPVRPQGSTLRWPRVLFLDGSRRVEARVMLEGGDPGVAFGVLGSYAVGAVAWSQGRADFLDAWDVGRICILGGNSNHGYLDMEPLGALEHGRLDYRVVAITDEDAEAPVRRLQQEMLAAESRLAVRLCDSSPDDFLVCDGPRPLLEEHRNLLGYVKTVREVRISGEPLTLVRRLEQGERSPLYLVELRGSRERYFEWFLRLRDPRPWLHSFAGLVRLQAYAGVEARRRLPHARRLADWSCLVLPRFASRWHQDPRAPQQLLPVRALERELRRRMGNAALVRRRITRYLSSTGETS